MPRWIAFVCAMPMELSPLKKRLSLGKSRLGTLDAHTGSLDGRPVVAVVTGMGTRLATTGVERLLAALEVERVVVVGITGAIHPESEIGGLVLPEAVVDGDTGTEFHPQPLGVGRPSGKMWTSDALVTDADAVAGLRAEGVVALDMETAAIARVCEGQGIPWSVFRAFSDRTTDGVIDDEVFHLSNQDGTPDAKAVAAYLVKHPGRVPAMARMAKDAKLATDRAAEAAVTAVSQSFRDGS
jgi:adenosylhomocysteine nucleosidase